MDICRIPSDSEIINAIAKTDEAARMLAQCGIWLDYEANELWIDSPEHRWLDEIFRGINPAVLEVKRMVYKSDQVPGYFFDVKFWSNPRWTT